MAEEKNAVALAEREDAKEKTDKTENPVPAKESEKPKKDDSKKDTVVPAEPDTAEEDGEEVDAEKLFKRRPSIALTPQNARFSRSAGGLISLSIDGEEGEESFERVVVLRSFPITAPDEFLSVREPSTRKKGRGSEIGMIRYLTDFDSDTQSLIREELELRYFTPVITKILSVKDKFGYSYWEAETTAGKVSFVLNNPFGNIRVLEDNRIYISDMDGNTFMIPDPAALDRASYRRIEVYI